MTLTAKASKAIQFQHDAETKACRKEYGEHQPVLADFKNRAQAAK